MPQLCHATQVPIPKYTHEAAVEVELDGFDTDRSGIEISWFMSVHVDI